MEIEHLWSCFGKQSIKIVLQIIEPRTSTSNIINFWMKLNWKLSWAFNQHQNPDDLNIVANVKPPAVDGKCYSSPSSQPQPHPTLFGTFSSLFGPFVLTPSVFIIFNYIFPLRRQCRRNYEAQNSMLLIISFLGCPRFGTKLVRMDVTQTTQESSLSTLTSIRSYRSMKFPVMISNFYPTRTLLCGCKVWEVFEVGGWGTNASAPKLSINLKCFKFSFSM